MKPAGTASRAWAWSLALAAGVAALNVFWLALDRRPFAWDESIHYMGAVGYYRIFSHPGLHALKRIFYLSDFYPPLHECLTALMFMVAGPSPQAAAFTNTLYLLLILLLLWRIGVRWTHQGSGILAGFLYVASTAVIFQSKFFMLDIPLTFWVLAGFYAFMASKQFALRGPALLYGAVLGAALLNKWSALFFLGLPPLAAGLRAAWRKDPETGDVWRNALWAYGLAAAMALPWYSLHFIKLARASSGLLFARGVLEDDPPLWSPWSWIYYLLAVVRQMSWPLGLGLLGGAALALARKRRGWIWLLWLGLPYLILTMIRNKDDRYSLPLLPLICLLSVDWLQILSTRARRWVYALVIGLAVFQLIYAHGFLFPGGKSWLSFSVLGRPWIDQLAPQSGRWPIAGILADVQDLGAPLSRRPVLRVVPDDAHFSKVTFVVEQSRDPQPQVYLSGLTQWPAFTDFAVTKSGSLGLPFAIEQPRAVTQALLQEQKDPSRRFDLARRYSLPDGSEAMLFMRRDLPDPGPPAKILDELHRDLGKLLAQYVRGAKSLALEIRAGTPEETLQGHLQGVTLLLEDGEVGDFQHNPLGVPVKRLQVEIEDLVLDLAQSRRGTLLPYHIGKLTVRRLELRDQAVTAALHARRDLKPAALQFVQGAVWAQWSGKLTVRLEAGFEVLPDPSVPGSDNLAFRLRRLKLLGVRWPIGWLQPWVEDFNPLIKLSGFPGQVQLGKIEIKQGCLLMGTDLEK